MSQAAAPGWRLGHVAGVPVYVARSWLVIAALVLVLFGPGIARDRPDLGVLAYGVAGVYAIALLLSVLLHEVAHAVAAQRVGLPPQHIVITLWGGHTQFTSQAASPVRSLLVAVVGPLANGALAVAAWAALQVLDPFGIGYRLVFGLAVTNAFVAVFNLVPGLPLDGGRVLEAVIWQVTGHRHTGTLVAAWAGRVVAVAVVLYAVSPLLRGGAPSLLLVVWAALIGSMLWTAAGQALQGARIDRRALRVDLPNLMEPAVVVPSTATVAQALAAARDLAAARGGAGRATVPGGTVPRDDLPAVAVLLGSGSGQLVGVVDRVALAQVPPERRADVPVASVSRRHDPAAVLDVGLRGEALLAALRARPNVEAHAVVDRGQVVGLLPVRAVLAALTGT